MIINTAYNQNPNTPKQMLKASQLPGVSLMPPLVFVFVKGALSVGLSRAAVDVDVVCNLVVFSGTKIVEVNIERVLEPVVLRIELLAPPAAVDELLPVLVAEEGLFLLEDEPVEPEELLGDIEEAVGVGPETVVDFPTVIGYI